MSVVEGVLMRQLIKLNCVNSGLDMVSQKIQQLRIESACRAQAFTFFCMQVKRDRFFKCEQEQES